MTFHASAPETTLETLQGLWKRLHLSAPGIDDRTTTVFWLQGGDYHVDMRLPASLPDMRGAEALAELDAAALRALARCEGFAGLTSVRGGICTWLRRINYRGPQAGTDVGVVSMEGDVLVEVGVHADYSELWHKASAGPARGRAYRSEAGHLAILVVAGKTFALGRADPAAMTCRDGLSRRLEAALAAADAAALARLFDMEFSCGHLGADGGLVTWSTDPMRPGMLAFESPDPVASDRLRLIATDFHGAVTESEWRRIPDAAFCAA